MTTVTDSIGHYRIVGVPFSGTLAVSGLPNWCTAPAPFRYSVGGDGITDSVNFVATCSTPTGNVSGVLTSSQGGTLAGQTVYFQIPHLRVTAKTSSTGAFVLIGVPIGSGFVNIDGRYVGSGYCAYDSTAFSGLSANGTVTANIVNQCTGILDVSLQSSTGGFVQNGLLVVTPTCPPSMNGCGADSIGLRTVGGGAVVSVQWLQTDSGSITVSQLDAGCQTPAPTPYSGLATHATVSVQVPITCTGVLDLVFSNGVVDLSGVVVLVSPDGGGAAVTDTSNSLGDVQLSGLPSDSGVVTVIAVPANCQLPTGNFPYTGLTTSAFLDVPITLSCH